MNTTERLQTYYEFDDSVVESVARAAADQNSKTFVDLAEQYGLADGPSRMNLAGVRSPFEYLRIDPKSSVDETNVRVYLAPMAIPADENMAMRAIRLFAAAPNKPLIVVGSPAFIGNRSNRLSMMDARKVWRGDLQPAVTPTLRYLEGAGVTRADFIGYSYGADTAAVATGDAREYGVEADRSILMEPASTAERGLVALLKAFKSSESPLASYVEATESQPLFEARCLADSGLVRYVGGLLRLSNIAIAHALSSDSFRGRLDYALLMQPEVRISLAWGGKSELTDNAAMTQTLEAMVRTHGADRLNAIVIPEMHHAGGDDIDLHAAIVLQALHS
jgi:hypothetical protein